MMQIDVNKHTEQTCHNLFDGSNVIPWKWCTYTNTSQSPAGMWERLVYKSA